MSDSPNAHIWQEWGLKPEVWGLCDNLMPTLLELVRDHDASVVHVALDEAVFQARVLPGRTPAFQQKRRWVPPPE
jgi:hypothetical protein